MTDKSNTTIRITAEDLKLLFAVKLHVNKTEARTNLVGVHFCDGKMVATDGHTLAVAAIGFDPMEPVTVPLAAFEHVKPRKGEVLIEMSGDKVTVSQGGVSVEERKVAGKYVDYRRAISGAKNSSGEVADFPVAIMKKLVDTHKALRHRADDAETIIHHNGSSVAYVDVGEPQLAVFVMPMRTERKTSSAPDWSFI